MLPLRCQVVIRSNSMFCRLYIPLRSNLRFGHICYTDVIDITTVQTRITEESYTNGNVDWARIRQLNKLIDRQSFLVNSRVVMISSVISSINFWKLSLIYIHIHMTVTPHSIQDLVSHMARQITRALYRAKCHQHIRGILTHAAR